MNAPKCDSDCREELIGFIDDKVPKSIIWKAILLFFMVWGVAFGVYGVGLSERKQAIKENSKYTQANRESIKEIGRDLEWMKQAQTITNNRLEIVIEELRKSR